MQDNKPRKKFFSEEVLNEILDTKKVLFQFLRHPLIEIKNLPDWDWRRLLMLQGSVTAAAGALAGLIDKKISFSIIVGLITMPLLTLISLTVATLFFYYCFQIFANKTLPPRKLFTVILFANIPYFIFQILAGFVPPITLIGLAFTGILLLVGFVENFQIDRKLAIRIVGGLYALIFCVWILEQINSSRWEKAWNSDRYDAPEVQLGQ